MAAPAYPQPSPYYPAQRAGVSERMLIIVVSIVAAVALLVGAVGGLVLGAVVQRDADQRAVCEQQGALSRFNEAC